jgi:1-acyl-sn-glycerol-3-phosphate acyltransferase
MAFKGGLFSMAVKTKVPIVPITICNTHAVFPANAVFPVQRGGNKVTVHVHSPIDTTDKTEAELEVLVREAFLSKLPKDQLPLPPSLVVESKEPEVVVLSDAPPHSEQHQQQHQQQQQHVDATVNGQQHSASSSAVDSQQGSVEKLETTSP